MKGERYDKKKVYLRRREVVGLVFLFLMIGLIIGSGFGTYQTLNFCVEKAVAILDFEEYRVIPNENVVIDMIARGLLQPNAVEKTVNGTITKGL